MMSLPFILFACAICAAWLRQRGVSIGLWFVGLVTLLVLFSLDATDPLNIQL